jgi:hypothetical protein
VVVPVTPQISHIRQIAGISTAGEWSWYHAKASGSVERLTRTLYFVLMIVIGTDMVEAYFKSKAGHRGIRAARAQYDAWLAIAETAEWRTPEEVKKPHPKASF